MTVARICSWLFSLVLCVGLLAGPTQAETVALLGAARPVATPPPNPAAAECQAIWERARGKTGEMASGLEAQVERETRQQFQSNVLVRGRVSAPEIAITIDDGPHEGYTSRLLQILKQEGVPATFFVVGKMVVRSPDLVRAIAADGHTLGNHSFRHANLKRAQPNDLLAEWEACQDAVEATVGKRMKFSRPPGGDYDGDVLAAAQKLGLVTVLWTDNSHDYLSPGIEEIKSRIVDRVSNGSIILLHDGVEQTIEVLPELIRELKQRGFRFVTIEEMWSRTPSNSEPRTAGRAQPLPRKSPARPGKARLARPEASLPASPEGVALLPSRLYFLGPIPWALALRLSSASASFGPSGTKPSWEYSP